MRQHAAPGTSLFNGWVIAGLLINVVVLLVSWVAASLGTGYGSVGRGMFFHAIMAVGALAYVGALAVLAGQRKLGAILIIVGSTVHIPLGGVGMIGGFRMLEALKPSPPSPVLAPPKIDPNEVPAAEFFPKGGGMLIASALGTIVISVLSFAIDPMAAALIGGGVLGLVLGIMVTTVPLLAFYEDYLAVREAPFSVRRLWLPYRDTTVVVGGGERLVIRYRRQGGEDGEVAFQTRVLGADNVARIRRRLASCQARALKARAN